MNKVFTDNWIPIKKELPPKEGCYLFSTKTIGVRTGYLYEWAISYKKPEALIEGKGRQFTAWQYLPEPYKEN